jgi:formate-dependent phosphoribosylglycinamide formyltransferase (GAR transformylase)
MVRRETDEVLARSGYPMLISAVTSSAGSGPPIVAVTSALTSCALGYSNDL